MTYRPDTGQAGGSAKIPAQEQIQILSRAVHQSPNAILIARANGVVEYVNPSFTRLTGYEPQEILGDSPPLSIGEELSQQYRGLRGALREGREWHGEVKGRKKNGESYWATESIAPISNAEGKITHFLVIRQDITQQKRDHKALLESEERFRQVAEMTGEWLWEQDPQGRYTYCSTAVRDILGYSPQEMLDKPYRDFLGEEGLSAGYAGLLEKNQAYCRLLNCYIHKDGHRVYTESSGSPLLDRKGKLLKWRGVDHNITARKRYEDALRLRNRAIEAASVGICIIDAAAKGQPLIYANPATVRITGYSERELSTHGLSILYGKDTDRNAVWRIEKALEQAGECEVTLKCQRKDGRMYWSELLIAPVRDDSGSLNHFIAIHTDISDRMQAEKQRNELDVARKIQLSLLPKVPMKLAKVQVYGVCVPAAHVGGDYFDYFFVRDFLDIVIADVSGHTAGSALIMADARSSLKAEARRSIHGRMQSPAETLKVLNEVLYEDLNEAESFISLFYFRYHPHKRELCFANAGHNPPLLLRADAPACEPLDAEGMLMGVHKSVEFEENRLMLQPGDRFLLYTDGIIEARNASGEFFDTHRLCCLFAACRGMATKETVESLLAELNQFTGGSPNEDDVTLIVAQIT